MNKPKTYSGVHSEQMGGMTSVGKIIRDAWVFELIPETETCEGWTVQRIEVLLHQTNDEWDKYGCSVSCLPEGIRARHKRIYDEAIEQANAAGWTGEYETDRDNDHDNNHDIDASDK